MLGLWGKRVDLGWGWEYGYGNKARVGGFRGDWSYERACMGFWACELEIGFLFRFENLDGMMGFGEQIKVYVVGLGLQGIMC